MGLPSILRQILRTKADEICQRSELMPLRELVAACADLPACRGFQQALLDAKVQHRPGVIAEIKKASPSQGVIREDFHPASIARSYAENGASCLSVLTDQRYFQGSDECLRQAGAACSLPVIRKDFVIDPWQVYESRWLGSDAILLIVAALEKTRLNELAGLAGEIGLDVLVEAHNEEELCVGLDTGATLIGINNRDLHRFKTDLATSETLAALVPDDRLVITESGIHTHQDVSRMQRAGINTFLVGEAFMRADDPGAALHWLFFSG
jgi:indole-3-glycerol phosphate synthase